MHCVSEWISYKHNYSSKIIIVLVGKHLGENGGDRKKMYVTSIISGSKVFLEKFKR